MNHKKAFDEVLKERGQDLKSLIVYFSVTRVIRSKAYQDRAGGFSFKKFITQRSLLNCWKNKNTSEHFRKVHARDFAIYQKSYNETLGIPRSLVQDILGKYEPTRKWISFTDALNTIGGEKMWTVMGHGHRVHTDEETNERVIKESFCRKIYPEDPRRWNDMLHNPDYVHLDTIPDASERAIQIITAWEYSRQILPIVKTGKASISQIERHLVEKGIEPKIVKRIVTMLNREMVNDTRQTNKQAEP